MRFSFFVAPMSVGALLMATFAAACSSGSSPPSGTASGLPAAFCAKLDACCAAASRAIDDAQCAAALPSLLPETAASASATATDACAAAIQAESQAAFCADYGSSLAPCGGLVPQPPATSAGGCTRVTPCADPAAICVATYSQSEVGVCVVEQPGVAGSTPCIATVSSEGGVATTSWTDPDEFTGPMSGFVCDASAGLHCDGYTFTCVPLGQGTCSSDLECLPTDACNASAGEEGTCAPRSVIGQDCSSNRCVPGASCVDKACVAASASQVAVSSCVNGNSCGPGSCTEADCLPAAPYTLLDACVDNVP